MDGLWIILISLGVTVFFMLGVPIFLVIGFWVIGVSLVIDFTLANIGVTLYEGLNFFGLLALPLFIMTGDLIKSAGIAKRLSDFAYSMLGAQVAQYVHDEHPGANLVYITGKPGTGGYRSTDQTGFSVDGRAGSFIL